MTSGIRTDGIIAGRLGQDRLQANFAELHPPLGTHEARVAADRCYFCHDAPCVTACPTAIDIPLFIRQIATDTPEAAARTILSQNILGGMCARVCPTETLCEQACVREAAEAKPVAIGALQRFATDRLMETGEHPFSRAPQTGRTIAVIGAGPAGLACAHRLALRGHQVRIFDAQPKPGGLNEYGIATYKTVDQFARAEIDWLMGVGGITLEQGKALGRDLALDALVADHDAVFLGIGLGGVNALAIEGQDLDGVRDAVDFIAELRQCTDLASFPVGRRVVVIGGGMTAVDAAVQSKLLGAEEVTIVYRRGPEAMSASPFEQDLATAKGVRILHNVQPMRIHGDGVVRSITLGYTVDGPTGLETTGEVFTLAADQILRAIGQRLSDPATGVALDRGRIATDPAGRTSMQKVWAGGDCTNHGDDLTVTAVAQGRDAAEDIHASLID